MSWGTDIYLLLVLFSTHCRGKVIVILLFSLSVSPSYDRVYFFVHVAYLALPFQSALSCTKPRCA